MIEPASIYRHIREGYEVTVAYVGEAVVKDANDAHWQIAVAYNRIGQELPLYVRTEADFLAKFALRDTIEELGG